MIQKIVENNEAIAEVAALLKEGHKVILPVKGQSMLPFIVGNRDSVELVVPDAQQPLAIGDAVLAWVEGCRYVLHRIVSIKNEKLVLMGDGNLAGVEHCELGDVVARAEYVVRPDGKRIDLMSDTARSRWQWWVRLKPVRRWILAVVRRLPHISKYSR